MRRVRVDESLELQNKRKELMARQLRAKHQQKVDAWGTIKKDSPKKIQFPIEKEPSFYDLKETQSFKTINRSYAQYLNEPQSDGVQNHYRYNPRYGSTDKSIGYKNMKFAAKKAEVHNSVSTMAHSCAADQRHAVVTETVSEVPQCRQEKH